MQYRPHIDGLRTVAVIPVLLFHVDAVLVPGGFTGVDIFFVISGFLITSLIVKEIEEGRFSILEFYKRRALRILPAFLVMIAFVLALTWPLLFPEETRAFALSLVAATLFVSNIYFWQTSGYFDADVETAPLLHTWTLSVEEQFYLLLPVFLILVWRFFGRRFALAIVAVSVLSFVVSLWGVSNRGTAAFYLLPTRAWEFGIGGLAAVSGLGAKGRFALPGTLPRTLLAVAGAVLVVWGFVMLDGDSPFPGANALWPAVGAMLLIAFSEGTVVGRLLSLRPMTAIGKISYSVYLWHWPLVVFWRIEAPPMADWIRYAVLISLSLALGALSYYFVEQPFRRPGIRRASAPRVNGVALASLAVTATAGALVAANAERWGNLSPKVREIADYIEYRSEIDIHPCLIHARVPGQDKAYDPEVCLSEDGHRPTVLVLGDSFTEHLIPAFVEVYPEFNFQAAAGTGCRPLVGLEGNWYCPRVIRPVLEDHIPSSDIDAVILAARWKPQDIRALKATVDYLADHVDEVVVFGPSPEYIDSFPRLLARALRNGTGFEGLDHYLDPEVLALERRMRDIDWSPASYVSVFDLVCPDGCLITTSEGVPYHSDYGHFTRAAAKEVAERLALGDILVLK
jgi:peptidoglycan/LPS O-acetylase OafA/YrhL